MKYKVIYKQKGKPLKGIINLTASKSESNRALIIRALADKPFKINNLARADDTRTLEKLLASPGKIIDVGPAGTTMRFLTAFFASRENTEKIITGSERMLERPIGILVDALNQLGADITYQKNKGYPPLHSKGKKLTGTTLTIDGSVSSQYITALILIAPDLLNGLKLNLQGKVASRPYIQMTLKMLEYFGVKSEWSGNSIFIPQQQYSGREYTVEGDWSSASYLYSFAALAGKGCDLTVKGLNRESLQGDAAIAGIMSQLGIKTGYGENEIYITKGPDKPTEINYDFSDCPDIAQTVAVTCAGLQLKAVLNGLESLKIKETDRVQALINELAKFGVNISEARNNTLEIKPGGGLSHGITVSTYKDHRMAMAFAPLAMVLDSIIIDDPLVVSKSYPDFWNDLDSLGFEITELSS